MREILRVSLVQTTTGRSPDENIAITVPMITTAVQAGAHFVMLPETAGFMESDPETLHQTAKHEEDTISLRAFADAARDNKVWLLVGSLIVKTESDGKLANRSFLIDDLGKIVARYDKIHLFDVVLASGEQYRESSSYRHGTQLCCAETPWGKLGMSVCYDIRFPDQYRALAKMGAVLLTVPSAFTRATGQAHWHALLRARAIENGCFVFAPAQCGIHQGGRQTYGHSLIVDPWGEVLADGGEETGIVSAEIDLSRVAFVRAQVPSLDHDRVYEPSDGLSG